MKDQLAFLWKWWLYITKTDKYKFIGFEVLTAANMKMAVFWVVAPCSANLSR
jgi:hypothetical protein